MRWLREPDTANSTLPELLEVETYRQAAARVIGRPIASVMADDSWYLKRGLTKAVVSRALKGKIFVATRRIGKLLLLEISDGHILGLRFGMTGVLLVDTDEDADLVYRNRLARAEWDRFAVHFTDGGTMRMNDPRRLGGVELDPNEELLGADAATITARQLEEQLSKSRAPLKARLMDQAHVAGVGNLIADEALWRAGLDPARPAGSLNRVETHNLANQLTRTVKLLTKRGGSHTGDLFEHRVEGGRCPRDGAALQKRSIGGRTTYSCPVHQI